MVIGNGLIAKRFESYKDNKKFVVFASGVSNSKTSNPNAYKRETDLLSECLKNNPGKSFVYFSTCSIYDPEEKNSAYVRHKLSIEKLIRDTAKEFQIFRVSNLAGQSANPNTVLNFFYYHLKNGINFDLWAKACRNIIDMDDAFAIIDQILKSNQYNNEVINIANPVSYPVKEIVAAIEHHLGVNSNYIEIEKGGCFTIDITCTIPVIHQLGISFNKDYLASLLRKYHPVID